MNTNDVNRQQCSGIYMQGHRVQQVDAVDPVDASVVSIVIIICRSEYHMTVLTSRYEYS